MQLYSKVPVAHFTTFVNLLIDLEKLLRLSTDETITNIWMEFGIKLLVFKTGIIYYGPDFRNNFRSKSDPKTRPKKCAQNVAEA